MVSNIQGMVIRLNEKKPITLDQLREFQWRVRGSNFKDLGMTNNASVTLRVLRKLSITDRYHLSNTE